ncbi:MAG: hypothetical protein EOO70_09375, partial [Myxococcaceae bacterium]
TPAPPSPRQTSAPADPAKTRLNRAGELRSSGCRENGAPLTTRTNVETYYRAVLRCLDRDWRPVLRKAGIAFAAPKLVVYNGRNARSTCNQPGQISFYCPDSFTIYMYADEIIRPWKQYPGDDFSHLITRMAATHTIAHEYGHHVQQLSGIFEAYTGRWRTSRNRTALEIRSELQASCLANQFIRAERRSYPVPDVMLRDWRWPLIYVANHGTVASQKDWITRGRTHPRPRACNTWVAPKKAVR